MIRTITLKKYLPEYIQEYKEIKKIMEVEDPEFQITADESEIIKNNLFIETCNETGISRFEKIMGIVPLETDTLESRISRVMTRWNESLPYTYNFLLRKLNSLCGTNNYEIIKNYQEYELVLTTHLELSGQIEELLLLLKDIIPVNIDYKLNNIINIEAKTSISTGNGIVACECIQITN